MLRLLCLIPLVAAQFQGETPHQVNGEWIQGNLKWNSQSRLWEPFTPQGLTTNGVEAAKANAAPNQHVLNARQQRLRQIYGVPGKRNANQKLRTCCRTLKQADLQCRRQYCDFEALRPNTVLGFMAQCAPKGPTVGQMWDCASSRADHTQCCKNKGVPGNCLAYCETTKGVPTDYLKYIVCLGQFDKIRTCFASYLQTHPNIKGHT